MKTARLRHAAQSGSPIQKVSSKDTRPDDEAMPQHEVKEKKQH